MLKARATLSDFNDPCMRQILSIWFHSREIAFVQNWSRRVLTGQKDLYIIDYCKMYSFNADLNHSPKLSPASSESSIGASSSPTANSPREISREPLNVGEKTMAEIQQENARLRKEIDAKETKLNSSMRSIKMFWSPELKKERAARKSEEEKYARLREQFGVVSEEAQVRSCLWLRCYFVVGFLF